MSLKYKTNLFKSTDVFETSNRVLEIKNGQMLRGQLEKDTLGGGRGLIQRIKSDFSITESQYFIDNLQAIVTEYMKTTGFSVGMSDLISNMETTTKINRVILDKKKEVANLIDQVHLGIMENKSGRPNNEHFETQVNNILNKASSEAGKIGIENLSKSNRFVTIVTSGSKGNTLNIAQMTACLGQQNVDNKRIPYSYLNRTLPHFKQFDDSPLARGFVENSFISGLTPEELFFHAQGGRVGLIDTAVKTSQTGYIQRRLIKSMEDIFVAYDRTVRNNKKKIIQYSYGGTNFDTIHIENSNFDVLTKTMSQLYESYNYNYKKKEIKLFYAPAVLPMFDQQVKELKERVKQDIDYMLEIRNSYIQNVSEFKEESTIYLPISFEKIINNIKHQFEITTISLCDITPLDVYKMIDYYYGLLEVKYTPCAIFKCAYYYYLNPYQLLQVHHFHKEAIGFLLEKVTLMYKVGLVNSGEMVGLISAQSIGEPTTQMTLNTFHYAGVGDKSNVTRGVPRMEEILALTDNLKNPSLTIFLKQEDETNMDKAFEMISRVEHTRLKNIVQTAEIYYDPDDMNTLVYSDNKMMEDYKEFMGIIDEALGDKPSEDYCTNKWILRLTLDKTMLLDNNITLEEIHYALTAVYEDNISCFYNDLNDEEIIFRIRLMNTKTKSKPAGLDEEDNIYMIKSFQENLLNNVVLRGINEIENVTLRKIHNYLSYNDETGDFDKKDICVLDTLGSNLQHILSLDYIDVNRTYSNNIIEMQEHLGIEAARKCLFKEICDVMEFDGGYINYHHIGLLCDRMTCNKKLVSIFRHGINNDNIGPIAKASFEETSEMFLKAARHGELDEMCGVSANIMCGQQGFFGTGACSIYLNTVELQNMQKEVEMEEEEEDMFDMMKAEVTDNCTIDKLKIKHNLEDLAIDKARDNAYEIDI